MDNNLYNTDKDTTDNLLYTEKNKNMDNNLLDTDKGVVGIPHCMNILHSMDHIVFPFVYLFLTKVLNHKVCTSMFDVHKRFRQKT